MKHRLGSSTAGKTTPPGLSSSSSSPSSTTTTVPQQIPEGSTTNSTIRKSSPSAPGGAAAVISSSPSSTLKVVPSSILTPPPHPQQLQQEHQNSNLDPSTRSSGEEPLGKGGMMMVDKKDDDALQGGYYTDNITKTERHNRNRLKFEMPRFIIFILPALFLFSYIQWTLHSSANRQTSKFVLQKRILRPSNALGMRLTPTIVNNRVTNNLQHHGLPDLINDDKLLASLLDQNDDMDDLDNLVDSIETSRYTFNNLTHHVAGWPNLHSSRTLVETNAAPPVDLKKQKMTNLNQDEEFEFIWTYQQTDKDIPYVGNQEWMNKFTRGSRHYLNSMAVFPNSLNQRTATTKYTKFHGDLGIFPNGTRSWVPGPAVPVVAEYEGGRTEAMQNGGFYLALSNHLPLDREIPDYRDPVCLGETWDYSKLDDSSVVITFYNEPLSTLMRSVHSVLNLTPPPLLREVILVDDHSNLTDNLPGGPLYEYVKLLPKVKIMRLPERRGLVWARLAGALVAKAPILVVLDSHIEVNDYWLEPQAARLKESPYSIVFPQILAMDADTLKHNQHAGIGAWLSWKWSIVEQASLTGKLTSRDPIKSASMAGGLFAVNLDWFWTIGGYDEEFSFWGAENVEMPFRSWMCGGRVECTPCAITYHIYRDGGSAYSSPSSALARNRFRTARVWMDEWYQIAAKFIGDTKIDVGNFDKVLQLKKDLQCKDFKWFLDNVDPTHDAHDLDDIEILGEVKMLSDQNVCIDTLNHLKPNETIGTFSCHHGGGTQGYYKVKTSGKIRSFQDEMKCMSPNSIDGELSLAGCNDDSKSKGWSIEPLSSDEQLSLNLDNSESSNLMNKLIARIVFKNDQRFSGKTLCLIVNENRKLVTSQCQDLLSSTNKKDLWILEPFKRDPNFKPLEMSKEYIERHGLSL